ncbi:hypothetical protein [Cryobacterium sp. TMT2-14]|uniref:hypothetical protein n=1 Tax=Cryobacterium sp. TMT2-14 TaxID=1259245 RepID=UPI00106BFD55|nr:hypothetical protein [Cryobacterium sp. TMT2-14]TFC33829.1 hypothetical protein E3O28_13110 [Cryobacterium sp. TMT2-14]
MVAGVLMVSGCAGGSDAQGVTPKHVEETTTTSTVDEAIAAIDQSLIDHVDQVMNAAVGCLGADGNPQATLHAWQNMRYVWLNNGTEPLAMADTLIKTKEKAGWTKTVPGNEITGEETGAARTMTRVSAGGSNDAPGLSISTGSNTAVPPVIYLSSTSTCFEGGALLP